MAEANGNGRLRITLGNALAVLAFVTSTAINWTIVRIQLTAHIADSQIHQTIEAKQRANREQFVQLMEARDVRDVEILRRLARIEDHIETHYKGR